MLVTGSANAHRDGEGPTDAASATAPLEFESALSITEPAAPRLLWSHIFNAEGRFRSEEKLRAADRPAAEAPDAASQQPVHDAARPVPGATLPR